jgi:hypothetical protein
MKTSEQIDKISPAIFGLQCALKPIARSKVVSVKGNKASYDFRYAPLDAIMEMLQPLMKDAGLMVVQAVDTDALTTRLMHTSGQWVESATFLNREHGSMQGFGGEVTYKRRYALSALLGIVSDDDNDVPKVTARGALTDAFDALSTRKQNMILDLAEIIKEKHSDGQEVAAYEEYQSLSDNEEVMALWSVLPSNVRSSIKRLAEADKAKRS